MASPVKSPSMASVQASLPELRHAARDIGERTGLDTLSSVSRFTSEDAALCLSELVTNALLHAKGPYLVAFDVVHGPGGWELRETVSDASPVPIRFPIGAEGDAGPLGEGDSGRGLWLVTVFSDAQECGRRGDRKYVRACFDLAAPVTMDPVVYEVPGLTRQQIRTARPGPMLDTGGPQPRRPRDPSDRKRPNA